jgi:hypothetical protein
LPIAANQDEWRLSTFGGDHHNECVLLQFQTPKYCDKIFISFLLQRAMPPILVFTQGQQACPNAENFNAPTCPAEAKSTNSTASNQRQDQNSTYVITAVIRIHRFITLSFHSNINEQTSWHVGTRVSFSLRRSYCFDLAPSSLLGIRHVSARRCHCLD